MAQTPRTNKRTPLPDDPAERFKIVANRRTNGAIEKIESLKSLVGSDYKYTTEQRETIINALRSKIDELETVLTTGTKAAGGIQL